jgi:peptide/nickel transport system substrate-binding protein
MFWLRTILFSSPLLLVFGGSWLFDRVGELQLSHETGALVCAIAKPVGPLNPLVPSAGVTGEIIDLLFDPLLVRDDDLNLRPHLFDSWTSQTVVTIRCSSEEAAGDSEARLLSGEYLDEGVEMLALDRTGSVLTVVIRGIAAGLEERLMSRFDKGNLGDYLLVRLRLKHSVHDSFAAFLGSSVEKTQVRMIEYVGDREVNLFVRGDTDLFLRELELYYESNRNLDPDIEVMGEQCFTTAREMLIDLRGGVKWHDGEPFTTADVVYSYERLTRPDSPLPLASSFGFVERLQALTPVRLKVECRDVPATMMESWEKLPVLPEHLFGERGEGGALDAFITSPIGTGPYQLASRRQDGGVELIANESYFRGAPLEKRIGYRRFSSLESILLALRSGLVEVIEPDERFTDWATRNPGVITTLRCEPRIQHFVAWNLDREPFGSNPVRLALAKAVNSGEVLRDTATEFQQPVTSLFFPGMPYSDDPMLLPLHDPRGAENLLDAGGYKLNESSGLREDADGEGLIFTLAVNEANAAHRRFAAVLAEQWAGVGVRVEVELLGWSELLTSRLLTREFDAVMLSWEIPFERDRYQVWHSSEAGPGGGNLSGLRNESVDELLEQLRSVEDAAEVRRVAESLQKAIAEVQPCYFIGETGRILTVRSESLVVYRPSTAAVNGGKVLPLGIGKSGLEGVRPWWVRPETLREWGLNSE